jgi:transposase
VEKIAAHFNWTSQTVREVLHKWEKFGLEGLWEKSGRGGKPKYKDSDIEFLEECLKKEPRTYNSVQLAQKLETREYFRELVRQDQKLQSKRTTTNHAFRRFKLSLKQQK